VQQSFNNVLLDARWQRLVAADAVYHCAAFAFAQPIECEGGDVRPSNPRRVKFRSVRDD
jgi:hypothetical protein